MVIYRLMNAIGAKLQNNSETLATRRKYKKKTGARGRSGLTGYVWMSPMCGGLFEEGDRAGDEVAQLYVTDMYASVKTRVM